MHGHYPWDTTPHQTYYTRRKTMSTEDEIRQASARFYAALNSMLAGDMDPMADAWSHGATVTAMHPIGGRQVGWDPVRESFAQVSAISSGGHVSLADQFIQVAGDAAYELGVEQGEGTLAGQSVAIDHRVTNVYRREGGTWKMVHHHTDLSPAMVEIVRRLQPPPA
jgi:ketosteroid isomerase-like protein